VCCAQPLSWTHLRPELLALLAGLSCPREQVRGSRPAVVPETARAAAGFVRGAEPHDRVGALLGRPQQGSRQPVEPRKGSLHPWGVHPSGVHRVNHDGAALEAPRPQLGEDDLRALGPRIRRRPIELAALIPQIVEPDPLHVHASGGNVGDPRRSAAFEQRKQQVREQERSEDVGGERHLNPVRRERAGRGQHTGVVNKHVEAFRHRCAALRELPH
jgi:hypothetical protein